MGVTMREILDSAKKFERATSRFPTMLTKSPSLRYISNSCHV